MVGGSLTQRNAMDYDVSVDVIRLPTTICHRFETNPYETLSFKNCLLYSAPPKYFLISV